MSEYFCHGCDLHYDENNKFTTLKTCDCTEQDILMYSAYKGIPLLQISMDTPCVFENTWQCFFNKLSCLQEDAKFHEKVNYSLKENYWTSRRKFALTRIDHDYDYIVMPCTKFAPMTWLFDVLDHVKANMSLNPLLEYLPQFHQQQKINTRKRLTHFLVQDIAVDIVTYFEDF
jgi:hypothetical protein